MISQTIPACNCNISRIIELFFRCVFDMLVEYMNLLFRNLPDQWELKVAKRNCKAVTGWSTFKDFAKVRFYCKVSRLSHCLAGRNFYPSAGIEFMHSVTAETFETNL